MNRIKISPLATTSGSAQALESAPALLDHFEKIAAGATDEYSVFVPMHYEKNYSYPLIVWLHSNGDDSQQLQQMMPGASIRNYIGIAPQAGVGDPNCGYQWSQEPGTIERTHESVMAAIDHASIRFNISQQRIFIAGYGAGGQMAFRVAFERPELFAGVVSINGQLPKGHTPLADLSLCRNLPVFWAHCRQSVEFLEDDMCDQLKLLHVAGFSVTLRQYPSGDQLSSKTLADMNRWIMDVIQSEAGTNIVS